MILNIVCSAKAETLTFQNPMQSYGAWPHASAGKLKSVWLYTDGTKMKKKKMINVCFSPQDCRRPGLPALIWLTGLTKKPFGPSLTFFIHQVGPLYNKSV